VGSSGGDGGRALFRAAGGPGEDAGGEDRPSPVTAAGDPLTDASFVYLSKPKESFSRTSAR